MTAENNGVPEDDDPFAYLYRAENGADGGAEGGAAATQPLPGVPRTSYQQATQVGRTQYGQSYGGQQGAYGQQGGYGQQQPGGYAGVPHQSQPPSSGGRAASRAAGGSGGGSRGVMIGAVAVVAAVAIGIGFALFSDNGSKANAGSGSSTSASAGATSSDSASASASAAGTLPGPTDAATMSLAGTQAVTTPAGAKAAGGQSVPITSASSSITWTVTIPTTGSYKLWIRYDNPGATSKVDILVNGTKVRERDLPNYGSKDPANAWFRSWAQPDLTAGQVKITIQGVAGQPPVNIDQLAITTPDGPQQWS
ncbi:hypothetical protein DN069_23065 [Streptacidiphilus pinicola]|uniref:CBM6 domain-containing protein n=1 Tax=Streptacidiphilus pinicola TaxID=2219663 RepID=A0A2X0IFJ7_9ACTN|nr:CBM35 domain-containing protein [Streptacidiphilus pinicola]RAG83277.1 hypothetical protein DN069_23065 [Streptacidiphilus pinicola]